MIDDTFVATIDVFVMVCVALCCRMDRELGLINGGELRERKMDDAWGFGALTRPPGLLGWQVGTSSHCLETGESRHSRRHDGRNGREDLG